MSAITEEMVEAGVEEIRKAKHTCFDRWTDHDAIRAVLEASVADRIAALDRNLIINRASTDLENIINGHDPEIHNLGNRVWDRLDDLAVSIEARSDARVSVLKASLHECLAWVQHWRADVAGNLKPTPDSLAMMEAKLVAILQPVEAPEAAE